MNLTRKSSSVRLLLTAWFAVGVFSINTAIAARQACTRALLPDEAAWLAERDNYGDEEVNALYKKHALKSAADPLAISWYRKLAENGADEPTWRRVGKIFARPDLERIRPLLESIEIEELGSYYGAITVEEIEKTIKLTERFNAEQLVTAVQINKKLGLDKEFIEAIEKADETIAKINEFMQKDFDEYFSSFNPTQKEFIRSLLAPHRITREVAAFAYVFKQKNFNFDKEGSTLQLNMTGDKFGNDPKSFVVDIYSINIEPKKLSYGDTDIAGSSQQAFGQFFKSLFASIALAFKEKDKIENIIVQSTGILNRRLIRTLLDFGFTPIGEANNERMGMLMELNKGSTLDRSKRFIKVAGERIMTYDETEKNRQLKVLKEIKFENEYHYKAVMTVATSEIGDLQSEPNRKQLAKFSNEFQATALRYLLTYYTTSDKQIKAALKIDTKEKLRDLVKELAPKIDSSAAPPRPARQRRSRSQSH